VTFTVKDKSGAAVPLNQLENLSLLMAGPTSDYGYTSFGPDVTSPGYVSESALGAQCTTGTCVYTFQHAVPAGSKGSFAIGIESRRTETLLPGTTTQMEVRYGGVNKVFYFSVDGTPVQPRRTVVQTASCNQCHSFLSFHGDNRNQVEMCVLCHNPSLITTPDDPSQLPAGVSFNLMVHRIHTAYKNYADVRYPAMSEKGSPGDARNCGMCHVNESETTPAGIRDVLDPQGFLNPVKPVTSSCIGCHVTAAASSHTLSNTNSVGESCAVCHGPDRVAAVDKVHAQY
jgi:OmcA/MtrC family decaheme c-type cytochrome